MHLTRPDEPLDRLTLPGCGGVYALTDSQGRLVLTIGAQSIRSSLMVRLCPQESGASGKRANLRAVSHTLWWRPTYSRFETSLVYLQVARELLGVDYRKQLAFGPVWFACLDRAEEIPCWTVREDPFGEEVAAAGPFVTRKKCARFIEQLEDIFDLCREHSVVQRAPRGQRCAYYDMGKCPAPCDGTSGIDVYRNSIEQSIEFALGESERIIEELSRRMESASTALDFESAQKYKEKTDIIRSIRSSSGRVADSLGGFNYLSIQRGSSRKKIKPFFIYRGRIDVGCEIPIVQLEEAAAEWMSYFQSSDNKPDECYTCRKENIQLVCHFISRSDKHCGLFIPQRVSVNLNEIVQRIRERFRT